MPPQHARRRRAEPNAGPRVVDDRSPAPVAPTPLPPARRPRKFTALLDADTEARFGQLTAGMVAEVGPIATRADGTGRIRAGYDPSRADLLRALLVVAENDPTVRDAVHRQVQAHYRPDSSTS